MIGTSARRAQAEDGAALVMALVFITVVGLVISAMLTQSAAQFRAADAFGNRRDATYAGDAGIEHALSGVKAVQSSSSPDCTPETITPLKEQAARRPHSGSSSSNLSISNFSPVSGDDRLLIVAVAHRGEIPIQSVSYGTQAMTPVSAPNRLTGSAGSTHNTTELWYILEAQFPTSTSDDILVTGASAGHFAIHASMWSNVAQAPPAAVTNTSVVAATAIGPTTIHASTVGSLVYSAASSSDGGSGTNRDFDATGTGAGTRLAGTDSDNEAPQNAAMSTTYTLAPAAGGVPVSETFERAAAPATHQLLTFEPVTRPCPTPPVHAGGKASDNDAIRSLQIPDGQNRVLIVAAGIEDDGVSNVQLRLDDGSAPPVTMTPVHSAREDGGGEFFTGVWILLDAQMGSARAVDIELTASGDTPSAWALHASTWLNVEQVVPNAGEDEAEGNGFEDRDDVNISIGVAEASSLVFSAVGHDRTGTLDAEGAGVPLVRSGFDPDSGRFGTSYVIADPPSVAYTEDFTTDAYGAYVAVAFRPEEPTAAPIFTLQCSQPAFVLPGQFNGYDVQVSCAPQGDTGQAVVITSTATGEGRAVTVTVRVERDTATGEMTTRSWQVG